MKRLPLLVIFGACSSAPTLSVIAAESSSGAVTKAAGEDPIAGLDLGSFTVGKTSYHEVRVRSRDARSLFFLHRGGLGSVRLRDLPPELQARIGYDPASAPPDLPSPARPAATIATPAPARRETPGPTAPGKLDDLFLNFDQEPELRPRQTLQPEFIRLGLAVKNQGRRPSCAVFTVISALEFQNARLNGSPERFSEEYLIWATRRSLGLAAKPADALLRDPSTGDFVEDAGYTLPSVVAALRTYGVPLYDEMPPVAGATAEYRGLDPTPELIERARSRRSVFIAELPGAEPELVIRRIIQALNAELPVPIGLRWPNDRSIQGGTLSAQQPMSDALHAVTIVGYECPTGSPEGTVFIFKNSYGPRWGQGGYGRVTHAYLAKNLLEAYVLEVRATDAK